MSSLKLSSLTALRLVMKAIILAGGLGTRLHSVLAGLPKPMAPVNGRPFLEYLLDYWISQGVREFILSVGYKREIIINHFGNSYRSLPLTYSVENHPLGTGGGLLLSAKNQTNPFLVLNGDTLFEVELEDLRQFHDSHKSECTLSLFRESNSHRFGGVMLDSTSRIVSFDAAGPPFETLRNGGVYMISPSLFNKIKNRVGETFSLETQLIPELLSQGSSIYGLFCARRFIDIGVPSDFERAALFMGEGKMLRHSTTIFNNIRSSSEK